jgi:hypothetical protein
MNLPDLPQDLPQIPKGKPLLALVPGGQNWVAKDSAPGIPRAPKPVHSQEIEVLSPTEPTTESGQAGQRLVILRNTLQKPSEVGRASAW